MGGVKQEVWGTARQIMSGNETWKRNILDADGRLTETALLLNFSPAQRYVSAGRGVARILLRGVNWGGVQGQSRGGVWGRSLT